MTQYAQLEMIVEEISHQPSDTLVSLRAPNPGSRRDSRLMLSMLTWQAEGLSIGQKLRVTVEEVL